MESNRCLRLAVELWPPFITSIQGKGPDYIVTGLLVELLNIIARQLNTCITYVLAKDRSFGTRLPNGTWTGVIALLARKEADMSAIVLSVDDIRSSVVSFSEPLYMDEQAVGHKVPVAKADILGFVKPYTASVWLLLLMMMMAALFMTLYVHYASSRFNFFDEDDDEAGKNNSERATLLSSFRIAFMWIITSTLGQASAWWPRGDAVRIMTGLWLFMIFILCSVYKSNLKAMMIMPSLPLPFNNIEELISSRIPTFVFAGSMLTQAMMNAPPGSHLDQLRGQTVQHANISKLSKDLLQGKIAVFLGKRAFTYLLHQKFAETRYCTVYMADATVFGATSLSLAFPKGSTLKPKVDSIINSLKESGVLERLYSRACKYAEYCLRSSFKNQQLKQLTGQLKAMTIEDFFGIFIVYALGMLLSVMVFLAELVTRKRQLLRH